MPLSPLLQMLFVCSTHTWWRQDYTCHTAVLVWPLLPPEEKLICLSCIQVFGIILFTLYLNGVMSIPSPHTIHSHTQFWPNSGLWEVTREPRKKPSLFSVFTSNNFTGEQLETLPESIWYWYASVCKIMKEGPSLRESFPISLLLLVQKWRWRFIFLPPQDQLCFQSASPPTTLHAECRGVASAADVDKVAHRELGSRPREASLHVLGRSSAMLKGPSRAGKPKRAGTKEGVGGDKR